MGKFDGIESTKIKGNYENKSEDLHGITWMYTERTNFAGEVITPQNRRSVIERMAREYKVKNPEATADQCIAYGKYYTEREKKHLEAYTKGLPKYKYKGEEYPVMDKSRLDYYKDQASRLQDKWKNMSEEEKNTLLEVNEEE